MFCYCERLVNLHSTPILFYRRFAMFPPLACIDLSRVITIIQVDNPKHISLIYVLFGTTYYLYTGSGI